jgi:hypothetical protein
MKPERSAIRSYSLHRHLVGLVRLPVHTAAISRARSLVYRFDQRASDALAARGSAGEQILQVAGGCDLDRAAVKDIVHQPDQLSARSATRQCTGS